MAQKIKKEKEEELLALGEKQEEIQIEETKKRNLVFPIILMIVGIILMIIGTFFNDITNFFNTISENNKETIIKDDNILNCKKTNEDKTLGLNTKTEYTYVFKNKKLQSIKEIRTIEPIEYSDIGPNNIKVINGQYTDLLAKLTNIEGLTITQNLNNNKIVVTINVDLKKYDATKLPENDKIKVVNTFNETSKSVKEKIAYSGDVLCE